jgi:peptidoglycan/LPS O-acetylase OafA/YrhL
MTRNGQYIYIDSLGNILCIVFLYLCFQHKKEFNFFTNKWIVDMGARLTYSSYVYQFIFIIPAILLYQHILKNYHVWILPVEAVIMFVSIAGLIVLSNFSYNYMESYFLKQKDKYLTKYKVK